MIHSLRPEWNAANLPIVEDSFQRLDSFTNTVFCNHSRCEYDYLVLAVGGETNTYGIPGVAEHTYKFKTPEDVMALNAALPTVSKVNIIGSGPTGIELACRLQHEGKIVSITEATSAILPGFSEQMRQKVLAVLASRNIELRLNSKITKVVPETDTITVWVAGIRQTAPIRALTNNEPLLTDDQLRYLTNVYAIGDCVSSRGPPTAQNARQQGEFLARHFNNGFRSGDVYRYNEYGRILDLNDHLLVEYRGFLIQVPAECRHIVYLMIG
jgi:NADPH-dependent 2,4-dienoyl-CoA reductase/sulfur reductase-like enzyme